jgi:hypothetical protein
MNSKEDGHHQKNVRRKKKETRSAVALGSLLENETD